MTGEHLAGRKLERLGQSGDPVQVRWRKTGPGNAVRRACIIAFLEVGVRGCRPASGSPAQFAEHGRMAWQNASGYNTRVQVEATMNGWKQVIGDELRAHTDERRAEAVKVPPAKPVEYGWRGPRWRSLSTR